MPSQESLISKTPKSSLGYSGLSSNVPQQRSLKRTHDQIDPRPRKQFKSGQGGFGSWVAPTSSPLTAAGRLVEQLLTKPGPRLTKRPLGRMHSKPSLRIAKHPGHAPLGSPLDEHSSSMSPAPQSINAPRHRKILWAPREKQLKSQPRDVDRSALLGSTLSTKKRARVSLSSLNKASIQQPSPEISQHITQTQNFATSSPEGSRAPSSQATGSVGSGPNPCQNCKDVSIHMLDPRGLINCAYCYRRWHMRCAPIPMAKEMQERSERGHAQTLGQPGWLCRKCSEIGRVPRPQGQQPDRNIVRESLINASSAPTLGPPHKRRKVLDRQPIAHSPRSVPPSRNDASAVTAQSPLSSVFPSNTDIESPMDADTKSVHAVSQAAQDDGAPLRPEEAFEVAKLSTDIQDISESTPWTPRQYKHHLLSSSRRSSNPRSGSSGMSIRDRFKARRSSGQSSAFERSPYMLEENVSPQIVPLPNTIMMPLAGAKGVEVVDLTDPTPPASPPTHSSSAAFSKSIAQVDSIPERHESLGTNLDLRPVSDRLRGPLVESHASHKYVVLDGEQDAITIASSIASDSGLDMAEPVEHETTPELVLVEQLSLEMTTPQADLLVRESFLVSTVTDDTTVEVLSAQHEADAQETSIGINQLRPAGAVSEQRIVQYTPMSAIDEQILRKVLNGETQNTSIKSDAPTAALERSRLPLSIANEEERKQHTTANMMSDVCRATGDESPQIVDNSTDIVEDIANFAHDVLRSVTASSPSASILVTAHPSSRSNQYAAPMSSHFVAAPFADRHHEIVSDVSMITDPSSTALASARTRSSVLHAADEQASSSRQGQQTSQDYISVRCTKSVEDAELRVVGQPSHSMQYPQVVPSSSMPEARSRSTETVHVEKQIVCPEAPDDVSHDITTSTLSVAATLLMATNCSETSSTFSGIGVTHHEVAEQIAVLDANTFEQANQEDTQISATIRDVQEDMPHSMDVTHVEEDALVELDAEALSNVNAVIAPLENEIAADDDVRAITSAHEAPEARLLLLAENSTTGHADLRSEPDTSDHLRLLPPLHMPTGAVPNQASAPWPSDVDTPEEDDLPATLLQPSPQLITISDLVTTSSPQRPKVARRGPFQEDSQHDETVLMTDPQRLLRPTSSQVSASLERTIMPVPAEVILRPHDPFRDHSPADAQAKPAQQAQKVAISPTVVRRVHCRKCRRLKRFEVEIVSSLCKECQAHSPTLARGYSTRLPKIIAPYKRAESRAVAGAEYPDSPNHWSQQPTVTNMPQHDGSSSPLFLPQESQENDHDNADDNDTIRVKSWSQSSQNKANVNTTNVGMDRDFKISSSTTPSSTRPGRSRSKTTKVDTASPLAVRSEKKSMRDNGEIHAQTPRLSSVSSSAKKTVRQSIALCTAEGDNINVCSLTPSNPSVTGSQARDQTLYLSAVRTSATRLSTSKFRSLGLIQKITSKRDTGSDDAGSGDEVRVTKIISKQKKIVLEEEYVIRAQAPSSQALPTDVHQSDVLDATPTESQAQDAAAAPLTTLGDKQIIVADSVLTDSAPIAEASKHEVVIVEDSSALLSASIVQVHTSRTSALALQGTHAMRAEIDKDIPHAKSAGSAPRIVAQQMAPGKDRPPSMLRFREAEMGAQYQPPMNLQQVTDLIKEITTTTSEPEPLDDPMNIDDQESVPLPALERAVSAEKTALSTSVDLDYILNPAKEQTPESAENTLLRTRFEAYLRANRTPRSREVSPTEASVEEILPSAYGRLTRKQMFGKPAHASRLDGPEFPMGLPAASDGESTFDQRPSLNTHEGFANFSTAIAVDHGEVDYVDCKNSDTLLWAPRDMIMTLHRDEGLAWRDKPSNGPNGIRKSPRVTAVCPVGKLS